MSQTKKTKSKKKVFHKVKVCTFCYDTIPADWPKYSYLVDNKTYFFHQACYKTLDPNNKSSANIHKAIAKFKRIGLPTEVKRKVTVHGGKDELS